MSFRHHRAVRRLGPAPAHARPWHCDEGTAPAGSISEREACDRAAVGEDDEFGITVQLTPEQANQQADLLRPDR
jgi:hypothetical protein